MYDLPIERELSMLVLGKSILHAFAIENVESRVPLEAWQLEAEEADWAGPKQLGAHYLDAVVSPNRIVFSLADKYKLDVKTRFERGILLIERVWTVATGKKRTGTAKVKN
jgi:mRNA interferase HigB